MCGILKDRKICKETIVSNIYICICFSELFYLTKQKSLCMAKTQSKREHRRLLAPFWRINCCISIKYYLFKDVLPSAV